MSMDYMLQVVTFRPFYQSNKLDIPASPRPPRSWGIKNTHRQLSRKKYFHNRFDIFTAFKGSL